MSDALRREAEAWATEQLPYMDDDWGHGRTDRRRSDAAFGWLTGHAAGREAGARERQAAIHTMACACAVVGAFNLHQFMDALADPEFRWAPPERIRPAAPPAPAQERE